MQKYRMGFGSVYYQFCIINPRALRIVQIDPYILNYINFNWQNLSRDILGHDHFTIKKN